MEEVKKVNDPLKPELSERDIEQERVLSILKGHGYSGSVIAATGFGKTRILVKAAVLKVQSPKDRVLLLVPFEHLKDRFKDEFVKVLGTTVGPAFWKTHIEAQCYASVKKLKPENYVLVLGDEIHLGLTPTCTKFYYELRRLGIPRLFATATTPEEASHRMELTNIAPIRYKISIDECVDKGYVSSYHIECVAIELTKLEQNLYDTVNNNFGYWKSELVGAALNQLSESELDNLLGAPAESYVNAFNEAQKILSNRIPGKYTNQNLAAAQGFFRAIRQRKELVDHASNKISMTKILVNTIKGKKLIFGGDNAFTDKIAKQLENSRVYHSDMPKTEKDKALSDFKGNKSEILCSTKALNQGLDVPDASVGIICGLTSKALTMIQRVGRLVRIDPADPKKCGKIVVVYVKNSQEEKWLTNALKETSKKRITWTDSNEYIMSIMTF